MSSIEEFFSSLSVAELAGLGAGVAVAAILICVFCCYCFLKRNSYTPDTADMQMAQNYQAQNPKFAGFGRQASAGTFARNIGAKPSASVESQFGRRKKGKSRAPAPQTGQSGGIDESSIKPSQQAGGPQFAQNVMKNLEQKQAGKAPPRKVAKSRKAEGKSYGRLDPEAQERIRSVRLQAENLKPIVPGAAPSAKALRMMGITEQEASQQYSGSVQKRMERIAAGAGGGIYAPGFTTAKFVKDGFSNWKEKLDQRKKQREERAALQKEMENRRKTLDQKMKPIRPPAEEKPKEKPKPKGIQAFLAEQEAQKKEEEDDEEDEERDDSEHIDNDI